MIRRIYHLNFVECPDPNGNICGVSYKGKKVRPVGDCIDCTYSGLGEKVNLTIEEVQCSYKKTPKKK